MESGITLDALKKEYRVAIDGTTQARTEALKARDYYDGKQFTPAELEIFRKRKQPPIVYNEIRRKVNGLVGYEITRRTDPIAYGRTQNDVKAAATASKAIRYVEEKERVDSKITLAFNNQCVEGTGAIEVAVKPSRKQQGDYDINIRHIPWEMFYHDPRSRQKDFKDASYMGVSEWMNMDEAMARWGKEHKEAFEFSELGGDDLEDDEVTEDKPQGQWYDETRKRVRVVQHWRVQGREWRFYTFTGVGIVEQGVSPYKNEDGDTYCPLRARTVYIDRNNDRHGIVRDLFGPQDEINKRRSKMLHKLSEKQFWFRTDTLANPERTRQELKKPDGFIEVSHGEFGKDFGTLEDTTNLAGLAELYQDAKMQIDKQGLNPALLGRGTGEASGRAILATQQGAIAEEAPVFDGLRDFKLDIYRTIWMQIKQFKRAPWVVRITDNPKAPEYIGLNQVVDHTLEGKPIVMNPVAKMDVDLTIEETADTPTIQAEQFEKFMGLLERAPHIAQMIDPIDVLRMSDLPNKADIIERIEQKQEEQQNAPPPPEQQLAMAAGQADVEDKQAAAKLKQAQAAKIAMEAGQQQEPPTMRDFADIENTQAQTAKLRAETRVIPFKAAHDADIAEKQLKQKPKETANA